MPATRFDLDTALSRFAPEVRLHPNDPHRPSSVEWYLERTKLCRYRGLWRRDEDLVSMGEVTPDLLGEMADRGEDRWDVYLTIARESGRGGTRRGFSPASDNFSPPCYVNARSAPDDPDAFDIQYWFFYPFNGRGRRHVTHEGDWEHVTVRLTNEINPSLVAMYVSAHGLENGRWARPGTKGGFAQSDSGHPIVYSAIGSHASYVSVGTHRQSGLKPTDHAADGGPVWNTSKSLVVTRVNGAWPDGKTDPCPWLRFRGRWGAIRRLAWPFASTGPVGPAHQQSWTAEPFPAP